MVTSKAAVNTMTYQERRAIVEEISRRADGDVKSLITQVRAYHHVTDEDLLRDLYSLVWRAGTSAARAAERQSCVIYLLDRAQSSSGYLKGLALRLLMDFSHDDFSVEAHQLIVDLYRLGAEPELLRLTGIAEITSQKDALKSISKDPFVTSSAGLKIDKSWNAELALARMGDEESIKRVVDRVDAERDVILRSTLLFNDLAYTKHPEAGAALVRYLDSQQRLPRLKSSDIQGASEAAAAATVLAKHLRGAPDISTLDEASKVSAMKSWLATRAPLEFIR